MKGRLWNGRWGKGLHCTLNSRHIYVSLRTLSGQGALSTLNWEHYPVKIENEWYNTPLWGVWVRFLIKGAGSLNVGEFRIREPFTSYIPLTHYCNNQSSTKRTPTNHIPDVSFLPCPNNIGVI